MVTLRDLFVVTLLSLQLATRVDLQMPGDYLTRVLPLWTVRFEFNYRKFKSPNTILNFHAGLYTFQSFWYYFLYPNSFYIG